MNLDVLKRVYVVTIWLGDQIAKITSLTKVPLPSEIARVLHGVLRLKVNLLNKLKVYLKGKVNIESSLDSIRLVSGTNPINTRQIMAELEIIKHQEKYVIDEVKAIAQLAEIHDLEIGEIMLAYTSKVTHFVRKIDALILASERLNGGKFINKGLRNRDKTVKKF